MNRFGHIDLRVTNLAEALPFYEQLMPSLGFRRTFHSPVWKAFAGDGDLPEAPYFALTEDQDHKPNANRIAFWAASREEVDASATVAKAAGAQELDGPAEVPPFGATYYAVFFNDPSGNRFEVYYRVNPS
jgi:catechol 2,3-dioxygenase-like lactoylglutathione lyase family enzyme